MAAPEVYDEQASGDARNSRDHIPAHIPAIDRRPWVVRVRAACRSAELPTTTRLVALTVASYFDQHGTWALPIDEIAADCGITRRSVFRHLDRLRTAGVLRVKGGGGRMRSRYSTGPTISRMSPAKRTEPATGAGDTGDTGDTAGVTPVTPVRIRSGSGSGSKVRTAQHNSTDREGSNKPRRAQCDDDQKKRGNNAPAERHACQSCDRSWPTRYGRRCNGCGVEVQPIVTPEQVEADRQKMVRIQALHAKNNEIERRKSSTICPRCHYTQAVTADVEDSGRCTFCAALDDATAAGIKAEADALYDAFNNAHMASMVHYRERDKSIENRFSYDREHKRLTDMAYRHYLAYEAFQDTTYGPAAGAGDTGTDEREQASA